ncbi:YicC family protein [Gracilibacillus caseinilyticus]|uniref:YicC family protein n=1 Tax=Gracilibacillus caseinilyticus TaxID=2932256 RepID=A0ABY4EVM4_9BACI|nr:YicC/YloC family endoribonuclease [Gracilibacillus caseinilyticus]UOQ47928.1 YicC family protein [Gracilibacillus caseinilyticus]
MFIIEDGSDVLMKSMTGFGRQELQLDEMYIIAEVKTVNHRYLDISFQMPKFLVPLEDRLKKIIQQQVKRGKVSVTINVSGTFTSSKKLTTNWDLVEQYINQFQQIKQTYQLHGEITLDMLGQYPDIFEVEQREESNTDTDTNVLLTLEKAVGNLHAMRLKEGAELGKDLQLRTEIIQNRIKQLGERRKIVIIEYQERIKERINSYLENTSVYDESRLFQEIALLAEKGDITEELTRIHSHVMQFQQLMKETEPIGRRLDFIVQELNRELNTIGSKSNDIWISEHVVSLKSEAERMKEQIQNVE